MLVKKNSMKKLIYVCCIMAAFTAFRYPFTADADKGFMYKATQSNLAEIDAAKLALATTQSDSIKGYAQMMINDHTQAQTELAAMAQQQGVTLPDSTDDMHRMFKQRLMLVTGSTFDSAYLQAQVKDHVATIALFQSEVDHGMNADCKAWAAKKLPTLNMHLQHVQGLAGNMQHM